MPAIARITLARMIADGVVPVNPEAVDIPLRRFARDSYHNSFWVEEHVEDGYLAFARLQFDLDPVVPLYWEFASWHRRERDCQIFVELCHPDAPITPQGRTMLERAVTCAQGPVLTSLTQLDITLCRPETQKLLPLLFQRIPQ